MRRVRITKVPKARAGGQSNGYANTVPEQLSNYGGADVGQYKVPDISTRRTLQPVDWEDATIEAEKGEVAFGDINGDNFAETYVIGGKRHSNGGTPLNLPAGTFIFSDFNEMKIKDPNILAMFGKEVKKGKSKKGYTPASLAKQYDINKYRKILEDKNSDKHDRETAQLMIKEYQDKLGALALAQESMKNFEQGIPQVSMPYLQSRSLEEQDVMPQQQMQGDPMMQQPMMAQRGGEDVSCPEGLYWSEYAQDCLPKTEILQNYRDIAHKYGKNQKDWQGRSLNNEFQQAYKDFQRTQSTYDQTLNPYGFPTVSYHVGQGLRNAFNSMFGTEYQEGGFTPHMMYQPVTGQGVMTNAYNEHLRLDDQGYIHETPNMQSGGWRGVPTLNLNRFIPRAQGGGDLVVEVPTDISGILPPGVDPQTIPMDPVEGPSQIPDPYDVIYPTPDTRPPLPIFDPNEGIHNPMPWMPGMEERPFDPDNVCVDCILSDEEAMEQARRTRDAIRRGEITDPFQIERFNRIINIPKTVPTRRYEPGKKTFLQKIFRPNKPTPGRWVDSEYDYTILDQVDPNQIETIQKIDRDREDYIRLNQRMGGYIPQAQEGEEIGMAKMGKQMYRKGGPVQKYQKKGEVTYKIYDEADLPEGTVIMDYYSPFTKVGDYVRVADGTIRKVKSKGVERVQSTETATGTITDYMATDEGKATVERANQIIEEGIANGTIKKLGNGNIRIMGDFSPSFRDRIILSRALNASGKKFGTDKYKVAKQSFTKGYSKSGQAKGSGNFVAGFTPEDYEKRFMFELMTGSGASDEDAFGRIDEIYADPTRKAQARRMYLKTIGVLDAEGKKDGQELTDDQLLSDDFYKQNYANVTKGVEATLGESGFRPVIGNEQLSGFEHFDALGIRQPLDYEGEEPPVDDPDDPDDPEKPQITPYKPAQRAPWWLQDEVNIAGNLIDRSRIKKYMPWAPGADLEEMDPTFTDPTFDANLATAGASALMQGMGAFSGPQAASARAMAMQGNLANTVAGAISRHNTQNVGIANQFEQANVGIRNQERMLDAQRAQRLYDQNTIANQQYDNAMLALRREGRGLYNQAVTNRWKTDALNQMYPDYAVDPSVGGKMYHDPNYRDPSPTQSKDFDYWLKYYRNQGMTDREAVQAAKIQAGADSGYSGADLDILNAQYGFQDGGYVMGSTVFPFMFY